jgi:hypothetical protein
MTDKYASNEGQDRVTQDELDGLISSSNAQVQLPSNFSHQVMQRILILKVERARTSATFQSGLIAILSLIAGLGLLLIYTEYYGSQESLVTSWNLFQSLVLPTLSGFILASLVMLDGFLSSRKMKSP